MTLSWPEVRDRVQQHALAEGDYSGLPMPVHDHEIVMAPRHRKAKLLEGATLGPSEGAGREFTCTSDDLEGQVVRSWWSKRLRTEVFILWHGLPGDPGFRVELLYNRWAPHLEAVGRWDWRLKTTAVAQDAWDAHAELRAMQTLAEHITEWQFSTYVLTGSFLESSKRSLCKYEFRKGRPTLVLQADRNGNYRPSVALCLHPLAYYSRTFAGGMVPTDDVIAHLLLMRADEARYWREANQHPIDRMEAGL